MILFSQILFWTILYSLIILVKKYFKKVMNWNGLRKKYIKDFWVFIKEINMLLIKVVKFKKKKIGAKIKDEFVIL